jgi:hypothetical protein
MTLPVCFGSKNQLRVFAAKVTWPNPGPAGFLAVGFHSISYTVQFVTWEKDKIGPILTPNENWLGSHPK